MAMNNPTVGTPWWSGQSRLSVDCRGRVSDSMVPLIKAKLHILLLAVLAIWKWAKSVSSKWKCVSECMEYRRCWIQRMFYFPLLYYNTQFLLYGCAVDDQSHFKASESVSLLLDIKFIRGVRIHKKGGIKKYPSINIQAKKVQKIWDESKGWEAAPGRFLLWTLMILCLPEIDG